MHSSTRALVTSLDPAYLRAASNSLKELPCSVQPGRVLLIREAVPVKTVKRVSLLLIGTPGWEGMLKFRNNRLLDRNHSCQACHEKDACRNEFKVKVKM